MSLKTVVLLFAILLSIGLPVEAAEAPMRIGEKVRAEISVCADRDMMEEVAKAEAEHGFEAAGMSFSLLAAFGICGNEAFEFTPVRVVSRHKTARGELKVIEIKVGNQTAYTVTTRPVIDGISI